MIFTAQKIKWIEEGFLKFVAADFSTQHLNSIQIGNYLLSVEEEIASLQQKYENTDFLNLKLIFEAKQIWN